MQIVKHLAANGSRLFGALEVENGVIYATSKMLVEDIFELLPLLKRTTGQDLTITYEALRISGLFRVMNMRIKNDLFFLFRVNFLFVINLKSSFNSWNRSFYLALS